MTTIIWSASVGDWKSLCVNELRLMAVPDEVRLQTCKVCVSPQIVERPPVTGCFSCRQLPARLNLYLDAPLTGREREVNERFQIQYPTVSLIDGVTGTWTTTHKKTWFIPPVPADSVFSLEPVLSSYSSSLPIRDNRCYWVWSQTSFFLRYHLEARGAPTQTVQWVRPVTGLLQEQHRWPSGATTVGPHASPARWNLEGRQGAGVTFAVPLAGYLPEAYPLTYWPDLWPTLNTAARPEAAAARALIDVANATIPTTVRTEYRVIGYAWMLQVGDGWNPLIVNPPRWRPSRRFTLTLHGRCMTRFSAKVSPGVGGYISGGWQVNNAQIDMTGVRPNTYPRDPFVPNRFAVDQWINPTFPASYFVSIAPGIPPQPIELPIKYAAPSSMMTTHEEIEFLPGIERGAYGLVFPDILDFDHLPHQNKYSHPFVGKDRPYAEYSKAGVSGMELGRWVGEAACDQNSPIRLTGGPTYPHRYGGPINIPTQVYLDIGNPP